MFVFPYNFIEKPGDFPRRVDPAGWLEAVCLSLTDGNPRIQTPLTLNLLKFVDNVSDEWTGYEIEAGAYSGAFTLSPCPFLARNDNESLRLLGEEITKYNKRFSNPIFNLGRVVEVNYSAQHPGKLLRMDKARTKEEAADIFMEGSPV